MECKKAQPKEVMTPTGSARGRSRVMPYGMDAFMLGIGMLGKTQNQIYPKQIHGTKSIYKYSLYTYRAKANQSLRRLIHLWTFLSDISLRNVTISDVFIFTCIIEEFELLVENKSKFRTCFKAVYQTLHM